MDEGTIKLCGLLLFAIGMACAPKATMVFLFFDLYVITPLIAIYIFGSIFPIGTALFVAGLLGFGIILYKMIHK